MASNDVRPLVILTTQLPRAGSEADRALRSTGSGGFFDAVDLCSTPGQKRLSKYAKGGQSRPLTGFWTARDLAPSD
jgi:hypothetical protein